PVDRIVHSIWSGSAASVRGFRVLAVLGPTRNPVSPAQWGAGAYGEPSRPSEPSSRCLSKAVARLAWPLQDPAFPRWRPPASGSGGTGTALAGEGPRGKLGLPRAGRARDRSSRPVQDEQVGVSKGESPSSPYHPSAQSMYARCPSVRETARCT